MLQSVVLVALCAPGLIDLLGCCADAHDVDQRPSANVPLPMWPKQRDYANITDRNGEWSAPSNEQFQFNPRIPKKPFTKKNNWLSFETKNDQIEVGFEFSVPFLSVPVKRSVESVRSTAESVMTPLANINSGAIFLAGVMVMAGVTTAYIWRMFSSAAPHWFGHPQQQQQYVPENPSSREADNDPDRFAEMMSTLDKVLQRYDIDPVACGQRLVCTMVQNAADEVAVGVGTSTDKLVDGLASNGWVSQWLNGSPLDAAMRVARSATQRCERQYDSCRLRDTSYELLSAGVLRFS